MTRTPLRPLAALGPGAATTLGAATCGLLALISALALGSPIPVADLRALVAGAIGSAEALAATVNLAAPLTLCALSVTFGRAAGIWNLGGDGQVAVGALAAVALASVAGDAVSALSPPALLFAAAGGGAVWAVAAGLLRLTAGVPALLSTALLGLIAVAWVAPNYSITGQYISNISPLEIGAAWRLASLSGGVHAGLAIALACTALLHIGLRRSVLGFELRVMGDAPDAARITGIPIARRTLLAFAVMGALAGLAGGVEVAGVAALLGRGNVVAAMGAALALAALSVGAGAMASGDGGIVLLVEGALLAGALVGDALSRGPGRTTAGEAR